MTDRIDTDAERERHDREPGTQRCWNCKEPHPCVTRRLADEVDRLRADLTRYGDHDGAYVWLRCDDALCNCGWVDVKARLDG